MQINQYQHEVDGDKHRLVERTPTCDVVQDSGWVSTQTAAQLELPFASGHVFALHPNDDDVELASLRQVWIIRPVSPQALQEALSKTGKASWVNDLEEAIALIERDSDYATDTGPNHIMQAISLINGVLGRR